MTEFEAQVLADLGVLKSQMQALLGIGQPGRLSRIEERMEQHEHSIERVKGLAGAMGVGLTLVHVAIDYFRR
ncbi:MAG: hypothetical protein ACYCSN_08995 [Acidobacteriaceae bacterium]